jgi:hypothetical protein
MFPGLNEIGVYRLLAQPFHGLKPVQPFDKHVALAVVAHLDRCCHAVFNDILGKMAHRFGVPQARKSRPPQLSGL